MYRKTQKNIKLWVIFEDIFKHLLDMHKALSSTFITMSTVY